jgi:HPt (histidine-containing phosphotransfer) domain-containing protein
MDDYLPKPFSAQQLANILLRWIPLAGKDAVAGMDMAPAARENGSGPVDRSRLDALFDTAADPESIRNLISLFLRTTRGSLDSLRSQQAGPDLPQTRKTLHRLKGSCATLGARRLAALIEEMETAAEAGEAGKLAHLLVGLEEAFRETAEVLGES